jgi:PhnB protein
MSVKLSPYLNFKGNTKEAMEYYKEIFGGKLDMTTFGDMPSESMPTPDEYKDKIMHASLESDDITIMASEGRPDQPPVVGDNISLSLSGDEKDKMTEYFEKLQDGGEVTMPLAPQAWGDVFGMCKDKFGIHWMVNIAGEKTGMGEGEAKPA